MRMLIIGSGGREHAFGWKIKQSTKIEKLFFAPGNAGTSQLGENIPVGVLAKQKEAETEDIAMPFEDIGRDVNVVYPIEIGKMFKGFYILSNGAVAIDYELTDNGGFENDDSIGKIDMNLN